MRDERRSVAKRAGALTLASVCAVMIAGCGGSGGHYTLDSRHPLPSAPRVRISGESTVDGPGLPRPLSTKFSGYEVPATHAIVMQSNGTTTLTQGGRTYIGSSGAGASWCFVTEQPHATRAPAGIADALAGIASSRTRYLGRTTINGTDVDHYAIASTEFRSFEIWVDVAHEVRRERIVQGNGATTSTTTEDFDPLPGAVPHVAVPPHPAPCGPSTAP